MKAASPILALTLIFLAGAARAAQPAEPTIQGDYLEVRTCDVYTGPCFANGELGLMGKEAMLVWVVREGAWNEVPLDGLQVIAVVRAGETLGDQHHQPKAGRALLIVDERANPEQRVALQEMARELSNGLIEEVVATETSAINSDLGSCPKSGCANVEAESVAISTRCLGENDHACGNETTYYPPLTEVDGATPAFTSLAAFAGDALGLRWNAVDQRSTFIGTFAH